MRVPALQGVVETPEYLARAAAAGLTEEERDRIAIAIASDPKCGDVIKGTGGARKVRFGGRGKGKSGGYRVITYYGGGDIPVFLLTLFAKGERSDLSQAERNALKQTLPVIRKTYLRNQGQ
jgi:hypothetical protein